MNEYEDTGWVGGGGGGGGGILYDTMYFHAGNVVRFFTESVMRYKFGHVNGNTDRTFNR